MNCVLPLLSVLMEISILHMSCVKMYFEALHNTLSANKSPHSSQLAHNHFAPIRSFYFLLLLIAVNCTSKIHYPKIQLLKQQKSRSFRESADADLLPSSGFWKKQRTENLQNCKNFPEMGRICSVHSSPFPSTPLCIT